MENKLTSSLLLVCLLALGLVTFGCGAMSEHKQAAGTGLGALGGAAAGAGIGSAFGAPGLGAAIGAGGGALIGNVIGGEMQKKQDKKEMEELKQKVEEMESTKKATTPEASAERRQIEGQWYKKSYVEDPPGSGKYKEVWVPEK
ncbi:MAG TPA: glycine zipper domain-containing protein [Candidatus Hypogeohydataceae bacterium YC41]